MNCHICNSELTLNPNLSNYFSCTNNECYESEFFKCGIKIVDNNIENYILYYSKYDCYLFSTSRKDREQSIIFSTDSRIIVETFIPLNLNENFNKHCEKMYDKIKLLSVFK